MTAARKRAASKRKSVTAKNRSVRKRRVVSGPKIPWVPIVDVDGRRVLTKQIDGATWYFADYAASKATALNKAKRMYRTAVANHVRIRFAFFEEWVTKPGSEPYAGHVVRYRIYIRITRRVRGKWADVPLYFHEFESAMKAKRATYHGLQR